MMSSTFASTLFKRVSADGLNLSSSLWTVHKHKFCSFRFGSRFLAYTRTSNDGSEVASTKQRSPEQFNETTIATASQKFSIPQPTWSLSSLQLHDQHKPVSMEELHILAKRSVLDVHRMNDETKQQLCQDLGNMLNMMEQVQNYQTVNDDGEFDADPVTLYDLPRGVSAAPFRMDDAKSAENTGPTTEHHDNNDKEQTISQSVRESYLEPKMKRVGGHQYYEIITSIHHSTKPAK